MTYVWHGDHAADEEAWERARTGARQPHGGPTLHGTPGAFFRHRKEGTEACGPCHYAEMRRRAIARGSRFTGRRKNLGPDKCGTIYGYQLHLAHGEKACFKCRVASAEYRRQFPDNRRRTA